MGGPAESARELAPLAAEHAGAGEANRQLAPELVSALSEGGLFRMLVPASVGGGECAPAEMVAAIEELARADAAAAWCVGVSATSGALAAYLPEDAAREVYGDPMSVAGGVFAPKGRAVAEDGGFRVSGRWPFASGARNCRWLMGGSIVDGGDAAGGGRPDVRLMLFPAADVEVIDTWTADGLRGTGSHDMAVDGAFVPAGREASLMTGEPREQGALYRFPMFGLLALAIAATGLGIARGALSDLAELAGAKTPTLGTRSLAARPDTQARTARAEAALQSARALLYETVENAWAEAADGPVSVDARARLRLAATHAMTAGAEATDAAYSLAGGTSVYATSPLQRRFRDIHVATQHMVVGPSTWELAGRVLLGVEVDTDQL